MAELEAWQKVFIDLDNDNGKAFLASAHGPGYTGQAIPHALTCQSCHAGAADNAFETMEEAHEGMIHDPSRPGEIGCNVSGCHGSEPFDSACSACHSTQATNWPSSLHANLEGEVKAIEARCEFDIDDAGYRDDFDNQCAACHATCGQCHVSRPQSSGSGFVHLSDATVSRSHLFKAEPHMTEQCTACHGTRIATDYLKQGDDIPAGNVEDIHWIRRSFTCTDCHTGTELHGDGQVKGHRYEVDAMPRCEGCHPLASDTEWDNTYHDQHISGGGGAPKLQCQICHSQPYRNCTGCHDTTPYTEEFTLKIARNDPTAFPYRQDEGYEYVLVRHVPIARDTYEHWGISDIPGYTNRPTWLYTSPHNIKRNTEQAAGCATCHDSGYYLSPSDLTTADEQAANAAIVIE